MTLMALKSTRVGVRSPGLKRRVLMLLMAVVLFTAGIGVGNGNVGSLFNRHDSVSNDLPANLDYTSVNAVYHSLRDNYNGKLSQSQLTDGLKHGLAESTKDPYTVYFTAAEAKKFNSDLNNSFSGIGAQLGQDKDGTLEIISPIAGLPADKAGVKALDLIVSINGVSTSGLSVDEAVNKIRGPKGTTVKLELIRDKSQDLTISIARDDINLPSVNTKTLDGNIGYIQITTFANDTSDLAQKAAQKFADAHVKAVILDLRGDPGGLLDAAVSVSSLWLTSGTTVLQERGTAGTKTYTASGDDVLHNIPTVVLVNPGSASASEITTGALHDNKAALVLGEKSYGKGVVQSLINFNDGAQLKVTIASWYRPDGENINHKGITPDMVVKQSDADTKNKVDTQLQAAQAYLNK